MKASGDLGMATVAVLPPLWSGEVTGGFRGHCCSGLMFHFEFMLELELGKDSECL